MAGSALDECPRVRMRDVFGFHFFRTDVLALWLYVFWDFGEARELSLSKRYSRNTGWRSVCIRSCENHFGTEESFHEMQIAKPRHEKKQSVLSGGYSQSMSVGHFDFWDFFTPAPRTKISARKRYQNENFRPFFENLKTPSHSKKCPLGH